ncbi:hypothetical protein HYE14_02450 [Mycoplasmopsis bovis]|nr:hypothetical protein [Mycoplasmopsis bovis]QQH25828.1 hypothetical protein HYE14_02450 [Mycoplasmopsis bovis]
MIILNEKEQSDDPKWFMVILTPNTDPTNSKIIKTTNEDNIKEKEQNDDPNGSGNSSPNTDPTNSR